MRGRGFNPGPGHSCQPLSSPRLSTSMAFAGAGQAVRSSRSGIARPPRSVRTCDHPHHQTRLVACHWFASVLLSHARVSLPCDSGQLSHVAARYTRCFLSKCGNPGQTHRLVFHDRGPYYPGCHRAQRNAPVALIRRSELLRLPPSS